MTQVYNSYLFAIYVDGKHTGYTTSDFKNLAKVNETATDACRFIFVKAFTVEHEHNPADDTATLVTSLRERAKLMQATFEAAHAEVLDQINRLLCIENGAS